MKNEFEQKAAAIGRKLPEAFTEERFLEIEQDLMELQCLATSPHEHFLVQGELGALYAFQRDWKKTEEALRARTIIDGARVEGWLGLAEHFHYYDEDLELAFDYIEKALTAALASQTLVRQVLGVKIRIALALKNYYAVEQALLMLVEYRSQEGRLDIALEDDFIPRIPIDAVNPELMARYRALLNAPKSTAASGNG